MQHQDSQSCTVHNLNVSFIFVLFTTALLIRLHFGRIKCYIVVNFKYGILLRIGHTFFILLLTLFEGVSYTSQHGLSHNFLMKAKFHSIDEIL